MQPVYWPFVAIRLLSIYVLVEGIPYFTPPLWGVLNLFTPGHSTLSLVYALIPALLYLFSASMLWRLAQPLASRIGREAPRHQDNQATSNPNLTRLAFAVLGIGILIHEIPFWIQWLASLLPQPEEVTRVAPSAAPNPPFSPVSLGHGLRTAAGAFLVTRTQTVVDLWLRSSKRTPNHPEN